MALTILTPTSYADANEARAYEGAFTRLNSGSAANVATLDIVLTPYLYFPILRVHVYNYLSATNTATQELRISTDGGATFIATNYSYALMSSISSASPPTTDASEVGTMVPFGNQSASNVSTQPAQLDLVIYNPNNATYKPQLQFLSQNWSSSTHVDTNFGTASHNTAELVNAIRFLQSSGNITSINWILSGMSN